MGGHHAMEYIPYGEDFPLHTEELIRALYIRLQRDLDNIELTLESVESIDDQFDLLYPGVGNDELVDFPIDQSPSSLLPELCALIGEVLIRRFNGQWEMRRVQNNPPAFEPVVVGSDGVVYHFASDLAHYMFK
jgi:hypothetical protein